jgi:hypothetical protein
LWRVWERVGQIGLQQFQHHRLRRPRARAALLTCRPAVGLRQQAGGQRALALHFHHAGAAVAGGLQARGPAQVRNLAAVALRNLQEGLARGGADRLAVEHEVHAAAQGRTSCAKCRSTLSTTLGAAWPQAADRRVAHHRPQFAQQAGVPMRRGHQRRGLGGAGAARRALAAGLVHEEVHHVARRIGCPVGLRQHDHRRRADEAAVRLQRVEVQRQVGQVRRQHAAAGPAGQVGIQLVARRPCHRSARPPARAA